MRRSRARSLTVLATLSALAACGTTGSEGGGATIAPLTGVERQAPSSSADPSLAGRAVTAFGYDLYDAIAAASGDSKNVVVSPTSVAMVLALLEPGASGEARAQLDRVLRVRDADRYRDAMNALAQELESLDSDEPAASRGSTGEVTARIANAAYLQSGYPFRQAYVDTITGAYGSVLNKVDFSADPDAVAHQINAFVADKTANRITNLVPDGLLTPQTLLTLVNALYLKGSWFEPFSRDATADGPFT